MTTIINGSSPSITFSDNTTQITAGLPLTGGTVSGAVTITGALTATGGVIQGANAAPAFYVYRGTSDQSITDSTFTKIQFNTEVFDTNSNFDSTTNYRFTPTVAGYYQFNIGTYNQGTVTRMLMSLYKNGSAYLRVYDGLNSGYTASGSGLIYLNGTTDYVEGYVYLSGSSLSVLANQITSYFQGFLARSA